MAGERTKMLGGWGCLPESRTQVNCNKGDGVCTGAFSISMAHLSYTADGSIAKGVNFAAQIINGGKLEGNPDGACKYGINIGDIKGAGGAPGAPGAGGAPATGGSPKGKGGGMPKGAGGVPKGTASAPSSPPAPKGTPKEEEAPSAPAATPATESPAEAPAAEVPAAEAPAAEAPAAQTTTPEAEPASPAHSMEGMDGMRV
jgi:hypothetical protein